VTVGTFDLPPGFEFVRRSTRRAYASGRDAGNVRTRQVREREIRRWTLRYRTAPKGFEYVVHDLWTEAKATLDFLWTPPGESEIRVRFGAPPSVTWRNAHVVAIELELEEVL
jgi:hypothetical protein